ncbi:MAG: hypothetical protein JJ971_01260 [Balneolaceae bacterium]|nr:hypothetical protein [Balneolaceae bacterium]MBO6544999.1 hypothetical protein [Balneolaceae bacterium]MBO6646395.1 hypothetical protein [Balneolaceae bacterium]
MNQTFLSLGAIAIFMFLSMNIHKGYLVATQQTVDSQQEVDAVNFGVSITDELYSQSFNYDSLQANYGHLNDINYASTRKNLITASDDTLAATIELSSEQEIVAGATGRVATVTIYRIESGKPKQLAQQNASIVPYNPN